MQFNGKTMFLLKQMLVYADIKEQTVIQFSLIHAYLVKVYCEDTGYGKINSVHKFVSVFLGTINSNDAVVLFLKYKHVDGCSFF